MTEAQRRRPAGPDGTAAKAGGPAAPERSAGPVTLSVVGDITFFGPPLADDPVGAAARLPAAVRDLLRADINLAQLESVLCDDIPAGRKGVGTFPMVAPTTGAEALRKMGVDIVTLATSHMFDYGPEAIASTRRALEAAGVAFFGLGTLDEVSRPCVLERHGLRIGFLGLGGGQVAKRDRPGCLPLEFPTVPRIVERAKGECDVLVVYYHDGMEGCHYPMRGTVEDCRRVADAGADLVVGTHAHTIQGIEWHRGVPIVYSLGNFITGMLIPERFDLWQRLTFLTRLGEPFSKSAIARELALRCRVAPGEATVEAVPLILEESGLPRLPEGPEMEEATAFFERLCEAFRHPDDPVWAWRDRVERGYKKMQRSGISWRYVLLRLHRVRWYHVRSYLKSLLGR